MSMLYYYPSGWINGQVVTGDLGVEFEHLYDAPREQVCVLPQASFDLLPRQVGESGADLYAFVRVFTEGDELEVFV